MPVDEPDDPLDALLAAARWPEVPLGSARRVRQTWETAVRRTRRRRKAVGLTGVATVFAAILSLAVVTSRRPGSVAPPLALVALPRTTPAVEPGRSPTPLELAMLHATRATPGSTGADGVPLVPLVTGWHVAQVQEHRTTSAVAVPRDAGRGGRLQLVERGDGADPVAAAALADLLADPTTEAAAARAAARRAAVWTDALFDDLGDRRVAVRRAAARALATIDGPAVTGRLIGLARRGVCRPEAVAALVRIRSPQARGFVAAAVGSPQLSAVTRSELAQAESAGQF